MCNISTFFSIPLRFLLTSRLKRRTESQNIEEHRIKQEDVIINIVALKDLFSKYKIPFTNTITKGKDRLKIDPRDTLFIIDSHMLQVLLLINLSKAVFKGIYVIYSLYFIEITSFSKYILHKLLFWCVKIDYCVIWKAVWYAKSLQFNDVLVYDYFKNPQLTGLWFFLSTGSSWNIQVQLLV